MTRPAPENPLLPPVRMRALYRGLLEARALSDAAPRPGRIPRWLEACWVATAMTLEMGDLTTDLCAMELPAYLRSLATRRGAGAPRQVAITKYLTDASKRFDGTGYERLMYAAGAAAALKAAGQRRVSLAYVRGDELTAGELNRFARATLSGNLPLVVVLAGGSGVATSTSAVPVIPIRGSDTLAIYRVAQEAVLRARSEGGLAILECSPPHEAPAPLLAAQMLDKAVCTPAWLALVARQTAHAIGTRMTGYTGAEPKGVRNVLPSV